MKFSMATSDSLLPFLCLCCFLLPVSVACPEHVPCGDIGEINFPFDITTDSPCSLLPIEGCDDPWEPKKVQLGKEWFPVVKIIYQTYQEHGIIVLDPNFPEDWSYNPCRVLNYSVPIPQDSPTLSFSFLNAISLLKCKNPIPYNNPIDYFIENPCNGYTIYYPPKEDSQWPDPSNECSLIQLPSDQKSLGPTQISLSNEIYIQVRLTLSRLHDDNCSVDQQQKIDSKSIKIEHQKIVSKFITIGVAIGSVGVIIIALIVILLRNKRRYKPLGSQNQSRSIESDNTLTRTNQSDITQSRSNQSDNTQSKAILESRNIYFGVPVFSYEELEEATNKFDQSKELGSGGFGTVYYGKLKDGREVAVKRLFERNYKRVQQFINEVKILTCLRHRNLVSLYGCTSRASHELLLVYEYISNGTLGCHLHGNLAKPGSLPWPVRMRIAIETANALSYLHACDIIHRDVKSSNLLLDYHFCIKVADFGLSRLFPKFATHVSTAPAGSPGYLDPEYHQCYQLTEKSDVYSFGVVLIELISSKPAIDVTRHKDEIKLANMAVNKIQRGAFTELVDPSLGFESDNEVKKMIISVAKLAFHCLERDRELRPSMDEAMEFLQQIENGNHDLKHLEIHGAGFSDREIHKSLPTTVHRDGAASLNNPRPQRPPRTI